MHRVLIANRGEIAVRIIHACHDGGRTAIAVYADDDADSLFVHLADEAYALPGRSAAGTYLNIEAVVDAALRSHADAVHPGYGFLSENAQFAQAVIDAGLVWIGPSPETIRDLGDKVRARAIAAEVGAPMAPGTTAPVHDAREVVDFARTHGLPIAIKAVYGGGGRGLKVVRRLEDVREAFESATHEALVAFGNGDCFIERFLDRPRHVEVQIVADTHGHVVAVGTRDCSLQRRNQKLIEEAPAPFLEGGILARLENAAVAICSRVGYVGLGTVEFLVSDDGTLSFMEVNTRVQVEHPVTELVSGLDLVQLQLRIAEGESIEGLHAHAQGHAMECRINAEDPSRGFVPFPGTITALRIPSGPGIRFDTGVAAGSAIPGQFDSMLAKLVVHAPTRLECIRRMRRALDELSIGGVPTVIPFDRAVFEDSDFIGPDSFRVYTRWIEEVFLPRVPASTLEGEEPGTRAGRPRITRTWVEVDGRRVELGIPAGTGIITGTPSSGSSRDVDRSEGGAVEAKANPGDIPSTITGTVVRWLVQDGSRVEAGEPVVVLEAMKMETQIVATMGGVLHIHAHVGDLIEFGQILAVTADAVTATAQTVEDASSAKESR
ncbi:MAG: ATP-grasp domain-containing protein [Bifidobacterium sp.]|jgi:acetyl-CoA/propionyl-CoA carboxylase biotin carboxyl carrier protein|nr:ATP-grasp domain-containing protein [Bifidobacterium sp.]